MLLAGAALLLMGEEGHEGDVGLGLIFRGGAGEAGGGDGLGVGAEQVDAECAGHSETRVAAKRRTTIPLCRELDGEEMWKTQRLGELSGEGRGVRGCGSAVGFRFVDLRAI